MITVTAVAYKVSDELTKQNVDKNIAVDPMMVQLIIDILIGVIKMYQQCAKPPAQVADEVKSLGLISRWILRRTIKKHIDDLEVHQAVGSQLYTSIMNVAPNVTVVDVTNMYKEVQ